MSDLGLSFSELERAVVMLTGRVLELELVSARREAESRERFDELLSFLGTKRKLVDSYFPDGSVSGKQKWVIEKKGCDYYPEIKRR